MRWIKGGGGWGGGGEAENSQKFAWIILWNPGLRQDDDDDDDDSILIQAHALD